jgi:hypothetical protein
LGVTLNHDLSWRPHISALTRAAAKKIGALFRVKKYFSPSQLARIYVGCIRPCVEYSSHVWGGSRSTSMLNMVDRRARRLIGSTQISDALDSLTVRRTVGALSLFYRFFHGRSSTELSAIVPPFLPPPVRHTRQAQMRRPLSLEEPQVRIERFGRSFFPSVTRLWNKLPISVFPPAESFAPSAFRSGVSRHLRALPPNADPGWGCMVVG